MRVLEYKANRVLRLTRNNQFVEKGGGKDGDYRFSKVELIIPEAKCPYLSVKYGMKPTVVASVNSVKAVLHRTCQKTVLLTLKNHVGWTQGMVRVHLITFKDECDALDFLAEYNTLVDIVKLGNYASEKVEEDGQQQNNSSHHSTTSSPAGGHDDRSNSTTTSSLETLKCVKKALLEIDGNITKSDEKKSIGDLTSEDAEDFFADEPCTQDWPF